MGRIPDVVPGSDLHERGTRELLAENKGPGLSTPPLITLAKLKGSPRQKPRGDNAPLPIYDWKHEVESIIIRDRFREDVNIRYAKESKMRNTLSLEDIVEIRRKLTMASRDGLDVGAIEPLNENSIESALSRQNTGYGGDLKYKKAHEIAASLFYGIAMNHAFENGNKRTALVSMLVCLNFNGFSLENSTEDELYDMATSLVDHKFPDKDSGDLAADEVIEALARWIRERIKKNPRYKDQATPWKELRAMLAAQGCEFQKPSKNFVTITRRGMSVKTGYPRENFEVPLAEIKKIRKRLNLTSISASEFYDLDRNVDRIVDKHSHLLERLADA